MNFNPRFFQAVAEANDWEPLAEGFWLRLRLPLIGKRFLTLLTRGPGSRPSARRWVDRLMHRLQPARVVYVCCYRKTSEAPFRPPVDVFANW